MAVIVLPSSVNPTTTVGAPSSVTPIRPPSIGTTVRVGSPVIVAVQTSTVMPTGFNIFRAYEGPQLVITWTPPSESLTEAYKLVRREYDFPLNPDDGVTVFSTEDSGTSFSSILHTELPATFYAAKGIIGKGIVANKVYFYRFFAKVKASGVWVTDEANKGRGMGLQTGYFAQKLWDSLPDLYQIQDAHV